MCLAKNELESMSTVVATLSPLGKNNNTKIDDGKCNTSKYNNMLHVILVAFAPPVGQCFSCRTAQKEKGVGVKGKDGGRGKRMIEQTGMLASSHKHNLCACLRSYL